jgi:diaminopimelate decarboxylase
VHVSVKSNSNLAVLNVFARLGAGFDIVSGGELARVLAAGGQASNIVFSGVGKSAAEMREALDAGVKCFNVESIPELDRLNAVAAQAGKKAPVSLRVNPDVDPKTHPYISTGLKANKFGVAFDEARATYRAAAAMAHLDVVGIDCHIGSQITEISPYLDALDKVLELVEQIEADGTHIHHIDVGGGLGITYSDETPPETEHFVRTLLDHVAARGHGQREVFFEPGRSVTGNAGVLLTRVEFLKPGSEKNFAIVDAAMNDLARPAMYQAYHAIDPVVPRPDAPQVYDVVGPVCESGDWLARDRSLALAPGDVLAIRSAGAYGFVMSSNYNTRPRAAEVMVDGDTVHVVRARETVRELFANETVLPG